jgi:hypothetical protein
MKAESDERIANNVVRHQYRVLSDVTRTGQNASVSQILTVAARLS